MSGPYRAVLFDMDGVLVDSFHVWFWLMNAAAERFGYPAISMESFTPSWGQGIQADVHTFFDGQDIAELEDFYTAHFMDFAEHLRVEPTAAGVFAELAARGIPTAVITNTPAELAARILESAGLEPDVLVGGTDVPEAKPAPDMVLRGCELLGCGPAQALVVGDSAFDRDAARAAGTDFAGLGIDGGFELRALPDVIRLVS